MKSTFTWEAKSTQTGTRFHFGWKSHFSSLLVFTWIQAKWNSNRYGIRISHFGLNEISNQHEIFMWTKFDDDDDDDDNNNELFLWYGWPMKGV